MHVKCVFAPISPTYVIDFRFYLEIRIGNCIKFLFMREKGENFFCILTKFGGQ